ncbi:valine--tRNA ligase [Helicobacter muridarum]|uniref:Valine--tRNA ligase n=1 Tax=Helicobacter muridarum TaxID=216 RepID=A0A377PRR4_9HELI|nr:valine--tRNA ligase [Helicobacter muridarum]STQ85678.1 valyl-tRNA synthetase [Helicobacter muridarum]
MGNKLLFTQDWESLIYNECEKRGYFEIDGNAKLQKQRASQVKMNQNKHLKTKILDTASKETKSDMSDSKTRSLLNYKYQDSDFCLMMPPPNVTGVLHIGHALTFTLQDIITRYKRMQGFCTLWQPGLDHAGIATQNVVEKQLLAQGIKKEDIGREAFVKKVWEWKEQSGGKILEQMRIMGFSPAFKRTRFTMDKGLANAVKESFKSWYEKGYIYRGERMINWCTHDGALSDIEVDYHENEGKLYYLRYYLSDNLKSCKQAPNIESFASNLTLDSKVNPNLQNDNPNATSNIESTMQSPQKNDIDSNESTQNAELVPHDKPYIIVATTRPETFFGDSALMVNPNDLRYKHLIGKTITLPLIGRVIPIIADSIVDTEFGSGAVKVTPAHDINDYEVGIRHNLDRIVIFNEAGILNEHCDSFSGLERLEAREKIVEALQKAGFVEKIEPYKNKVGKCYRCGNVIEPYISKQWFVKADIARGAIERVANNEARFYPSQWRNNYDAWMRDLRDWCISRQLWWGHRIPVFYCDCGHEFVSKEDNPLCPKCGNQTKQDSDVLDTWFSSGLWTHSALGFGNGDFGKGELWNEGDLERFHPNSLLITGFDILFFWVARMLLSSDINCNEIAFKDIYLHALVLDEKGQKMSKSKGNVIDPLELCNKYSPDIVRFSLAYLCIQGRDIRLSTKQLEITRNFTNKIANAMKFLQLYASQLDPNYSFECLDSINSYKTPLGIYMKSRLNLAILESRNALDSYRFDLYASTIYRFLWNEFCDIGIEYAKADKQSVFELASVFIESMKLLHPLMPFLSEYVFQSLLGRDIESGLGKHDSIMIESFPSDISRKIGYEEAFEMIGDCIITIRRMRATFGIANQEIGYAFIQPHNPDFAALNKSLGKGLLADEISLQELGLRFITKIGRIKRLFLVNSKPDKCVGDIGNYAQIFIGSKNLDIDGILSRLTNQEAKLKKEMTKLQGMLNNPNFLSHAPKDIIDNNQKALQDLEQKLNATSQEKDFLLQQI